MNIYWLVLFVLSQFVVSVVPCLRSQVLYRRFNLRISLWDLYKIAFISAMINIVTPFKVGKVMVRPFILKKIANIEYKKSLYIASLEQVIDFSVQSMLLLFFVNTVVRIPGIDVTHLLIVSLMFFAFISILFFVRQVISFSDKTLGLLRHIIPQKIRIYLKSKFSFGREQFTGLISEFQNSSSKKRDFASIIIVTAVSFMIYPAGPFLLLLTLDIPISYLEAIIVLWFPSLIDRISGIPGGLVVRDGAMVFTLTLFGIPVAKAVYAAALYRILTSAILFLVGIPSSSAYGIGLYNLREKTYGG